MTITTQDLSRLADIAATVATEAAQADQARAELWTAQAELLGRVIDLARPALRAIGTRTKIAVSVAHHADVNFNGGVDTIEWLSSRALCLSNEKPGPREDTPRANTGTYHGRDLFLVENGTLIGLHYSGTWSRWEGSSWGWSAELVYYEELLDIFLDKWSDVEEYVSTIAAALEKAAGSRQGATKAARERTAQLQAVVALLGKSGRS
jgi:hypothetical protein